MCRRAIAGTCRSCRSRLVAYGGHPMAEDFCGHRRAAATSLPNTPLTARSVTAPERDPRKTCKLNNCCEYS